MLRKLPRNLPEKSQLGRERCEQPHRHRRRPESARGREGGCDGGDVAQSAVEGALLRAPPPRPSPAAAAHQKARHHLPARRIEQPRDCSQLLPSRSRHGGGGGGGGGVLRPQLQVRVDEEGEAGESGAEGLVGGARSAAREGQQRGGERAKRAAQDALCDAEERSGRPRQRAAQREQHADARRAGEHLARDGRQLGDRVAQQVEGGQAGEREHHAGGVGVGGGQRTDQREPPERNSGQRCQRRLDAAADGCAESAIDAQDRKDG